MVKRLEHFPTIHQTFNLVPSLLDQLEEYLPPTNRSDQFFELSTKPAAALTQEEHQFLLQWFFLANHERMIRPHPRYHDLLAKRGLHIDEQDWPRVQKRFHTQDYLDLQVWFNLVWIDPWLRQMDSKLAQLEAKGSHFTEEEKRYVLASHLALIAQVIPAYRTAATQGQIELTTSPYYHPIIPLLCDTRSGRVALPSLQLPETLFRYPEDARWHIQQALHHHEAMFGTSPRGMWPPEGSVSEDLVKLLLESNVRWMAADETILWHTLNAPKSQPLLYRPHLIRRKEGRIAIVFRDRELSDLIGFVYSQWDPQIAVTDFLKRLGEIHQQMVASEHPALVSIVLDGENAWEFYSNNGHEFLMSLYQALAHDERFACVTVSEFLDRYPLDHAESLPELWSGSWIDGNFATWIGHPEKNTAWEHLGRAREVIGFCHPVHERAWRSLAAAEGSDWMWWFGDTHASAQAADFDRLFRLHLTNAYQLAGLAVPPELSKPIQRHVSQLLIEPTGPIRPIIDGRETSYYEWLYAGRIDLRQQYAAIQRAEQCLRYLFYGFDQTNLYVRIDLDHTQLTPSGWSIELILARGLPVHIQPFRQKDHGQTVQASLALSPPVSISCAMGQVLELAIPLPLLELTPGEKLQLVAGFLRGRELVERYPLEGTFELSMSTTELEAQTWSV